MPDDTATARRPAFDELPIHPELGLRHAWFAVPDDELGSVGQLTAGRLVAALSSVRDGRTVNVTVPIGGFDPPLYGRESGVHTIFKSDRNTWDDRLDGLFLQSVSHWDGLRHVQARQHGHWGGRTDFDALRADGGPIGVEHWARHGIVGRGVLLDVAGLLEADEGGFDPMVERAIPVETLRIAASRQGVRIGAGDVLCLRFGWARRYLDGDPDARRAAATTMAYAGLAADEDMARWIWDTGLAAVAADNPSVELSPGDAAVGSLHRRLIPMLGTALGELFDFDELAAACRADGRWDFLFVSVPLNLPGGVGSPANAIVIR